MSDTTTLDEQIAALTAQRNAVAEKEAVAAAFKDSDGVAFTDPFAVNQALLRSAGIAMERRLASADFKDWKDLPSAELFNRMTAATTNESFVDVALYAAMLGAQHAL